MHVEEIRQVHYDISFKKNVAPTWDNGPGSLNQNYQYRRHTDQLPDSIDGNNPTIELLTTQRDSWHDESNKLIPSDPRFISRTDDMSFDMAQFTSTGVSDDEMPNLLPLGY